MKPRAVVDIGGTKIAAARIGADGLILDEAIRTRTPRGGGAVLDAAATLIQSLPDTSGSIGVATAGVVDEDGVVLFSASTMHDWAGTDIRRGLRERLNRRVTVINDVHAVALAEAHYGAARGAGRVLAVAVGTGIGGGVVAEGRIVRGAAGVAGSVGHVAVVAAEATECTCGAIGHAEAVASGPALERFYATLTGFTDVPLRVVARRAAQGEAMALQTVRFGGEVLGEALASAASICEPDVIVVGGGVSEIGEVYLQAAHAAYAARAMPSLRRIPFVPAELGVDAPLVGAALL